MDEKVRIDKWLWAVRLFKTRSLAAIACEKGKIISGDHTVKAGKPVKPGEIIQIHRGAWMQTVKVNKLTGKRMSAAMVQEFMTDITPESEIRKFRDYQAARAEWNPKHGPGRPTKKDRRDMDEFLDT